MTMDKRLRTVGNCIKSMADRWDASAGINDDVLSDIEVDLEHALAALRDFRREEQASLDFNFILNNGNH
jgi:hypothetical protein